MIRRAGVFLRKQWVAGALGVRRAARKVASALIPLAAAMIGAAIGTPLHAETLVPAASVDRNTLETAAGVAHVVGSILAYTRWPQKPDPVRLCVVGPAKHADQLSGPLPGGAVAVRRALPTGAPEITSACDVLYFGDIGPLALRRATASVRDKAVLTLAESDPGCRGGAMFCLRFDPRLSFALNIDAITRSTIRVDPRVLRVSRGN